MQTRSWLVLLSAVAVVLLAAVAMVVLTPAPNHPGTTAQKVQVAIVAGASGEYTFTPPSLHALPEAGLQITSLNDDLQNHSTAWTYCNVTGTMDGMMDSGYPGMMGGGMGMTLMGSLAANHVSHTFTIVGHGYNVNIPIPPAASNGQPSTTTFLIQMHGTDTLTWTCESETMPGGLSPGMMGTVSVA